MAHEASSDIRLDFVELEPSELEDGFASAVSHGLSQSQKSLPSRFFYDTAGSKLFERITKLPEYYLTGCELEILERFATEIVAEVGGPLEIVEFGSGSSRKTRLLLDAALKAHDTIRYVPIDISGSFLHQSARSLLQSYPRLQITALAAEYFQALGALPHTRSIRLFLFMGSNIGNFTDNEASAFLKVVASAMGPNDYLLIGFDLDKDPKIIEEAYNDGAGVTEAFNKNILARINKELGGQFDLEAFAHSAPYLPELGKVEMRLVSKGNQEVPIYSLDRVFQFQAGETVHTEDSRKYSPEAVDRLVQGARLRIEDCWTDSRGWFGLFLLKTASIS